MAGAVAPEPAPDAAASGSHKAGQLRIRDLLAADATEDESEVRAELLKMDGDGDGFISLKELGEVARRTTKLEKNARNLKRAALGVVLAAAVFVALALASTVAAIQLTKDVWVKDGKFQDDSGAPLATSGVNAPLMIRSNMTREQMLRVETIQMTLLDPTADGELVSRSWSVSGFSKNADGSQVRFYTTQRDKILVEGTEMSALLWIEEDAQYVKVRGISAEDLEDEEGRRRLLFFGSGESNIGYGGNLQLDFSNAFKDFNLDLSDLHINANFGVTSKPEPPPPPPPPSPPDRRFRCVQTQKWDKIREVWRTGDYCGEWTAQEARDKPYKGFAYTGCRTIWGKQCTHEQAKFLNWCVDGMTYAACEASILGN